MAQVSSSEINQDQFLYRGNPWKLSVKVAVIIYQVHINT